MVASLHTVCIPAYNATSQGLQDLAVLLTATSGNVVRMSCCMRHRMGHRPGVHRRATSGTWHACLLSQTRLTSCSTGILSW